jgi:hypothetical protein
MELDLINNLATPAGIVLFAGIIIQYIKTQFKLDSTHKWYSLLIIGMNAAICGILAWMGYLLLPAVDIELTVNDAFLNWVNSWGATIVSYQVLKGANKIVSKP